MEKNWPLGPDSFKELLDWPKRYAQAMLLKEDNLKRFKKLAQHEIRVHDAYAGMGTGGWTLHLQHAAMMRDSLQD